MAIAFRSISNTTYASRANTTVTAPSGITDDDILVLNIFILRSGSAPAAPTAPTGFTLLHDETREGGFNYFGRNITYWKRASSESGNYSFTHPNRSTQATMLCYSGCVASGSPVDASSGNQGDNSTSTYTGVTTTVADTMLIAIGSDWADTTNNLTPPTGFTERLDVTLTHAFDKAQASSGSTGNFTHTNNSVGASSPWFATLVALEPAAAGYADMVVTSGSLTLTGQSVTMTVSRLMTVTPGAVTLTGQSIGLDGSRLMTVTSGLLTLSGQSIGIDASHLMTVTPASVTLSGQSISLTAAKVFDVIPGAITLTGQSVTMTQDAAPMTVTPGAVALTGQSIGLDLVRLMTVTPAAISLTGQSVTMTAGRLMTVTPGAVTLTGDQQTLTASRLMTVTPGALTLTGQSVAMDAVAPMTVTPGAIALTGQSVTMTSARLMTVNPGALALTGTAITLRYSAAVASNTRNQINVGISVGI